MAIGSVRMMIDNGSMMMTMMPHVILNKKWQWPQTSLKKNNGIITIQPSPLIMQPLALDPVSLKDADKLSFEALCKISYNFAIKQQ